MKDWGLKHCARYSPSPDCFASSLRSCAVEILLCRGSAQKIGTDSGKKLQKNNIKRKKIQPKITTRPTVIPKTRSKTQKPQPKTPDPYDPQNPYKEPQSGPKDITVKDIEKHLIENNPSKGVETNMDTHKSDEAQNDSFETIEPEKNNPVRKEFKIGQLGQEQLQQDESTRDKMGGAPGNTKPSQRKF